jgi:hypothetical protein
MKRNYNPSDEFFYEGNTYRLFHAKVYSSDSYNDNLISHHSSSSAPALSCCGLSFEHNSLYEQHYYSSHVNLCSICHQRFPNEFLFSLHQLERHDHLFFIQSKQQKSYQCLVEGCKKKCSNRYKRQLHLQTVHSYPKQFEYDKFIDNDEQNKIKTHKHNLKQQRKLKHNTEKLSRDQRMQEPNAEGETADLAKLEVAMLEEEIKSSPQSNHDHTKFINSSNNFHINDNITRTTGMAKAAVRNPALAFRPRQMQVKEPTKPIQTIHIPSVTHFPPEQKQADRSIMDVNADPDELAHYVSRLSIASKIPKKIEFGHSVR